MAAGWSQIGFPEMLTTRRLWVAACGFQLNREGVSGAGIYRPAWNVVEGLIRAVSEGKSFFWKSFLFSEKLLFLQRFWNARANQYIEKIP